MPTAQDTTAAISISGLVKDFGTTRALDHLDLTVRRGEVHGFLGPNGAGKTTTARILLGLLRKTAGTATVLGEDPWRDAVTLHRRLAYVPGEVNLWPNLTVSWTIVALSILLGPLFGPTVDLPQWAQDLSPFTHIPKVPAAALTVTPIVALTAIAAAFALAGVSAFRRRNLALPT